MFELIQSVEPIRGYHLVAGKATCKYCHVIYIQCMCLYMFIVSAVVVVQEDVYVGSHSNGSMFVSVRYGPSLAVPLARVLRGRVLACTSLASAVDAWVAFPRL
jgi:hypothetical protein